MTTPTKPFNGFLEGFQFIWSQTKKPIRHPTFVLFFFFAIVFCGCMGVWYEWRHLKNAEYQSLFNSIILLTPPFISGAYLQIILTKNAPTFVKGLLGFFVFTASYIFYELIGSVFEASNLKVYLLTALMTLISLWVTWVQLSLSEDLYDKPVEKAALGGKNLNKDLSGEIPVDFES